MIRLLLKKGADINARNKDGNTALLISSSKNHDLDFITEFLVKNGADINVKNSEGATALIIASEKGHLNAVKLFLVYDCDINAQDNDGNTALMKAQSKGHIEIMNLLSDYAPDQIETKIRIEKQIKVIRFPYFFDCLHLHLKYFDCSVDLNVKNRKGDTLLIEAASNNYFELVGLLFNKTVSIKSKNKSVDVNCKNKNERNVASANGT